MMDPISFFVPGDPIAKGRPKTRVVQTTEGKAFATIYTPTKTRVATTNFFAVAVRYRPAAPHLGPVILTLKFVLPIPKSTTKKKRAEIAEGWNAHIKKPDLDNLIKLVKDAMGKDVFWHSDSQVYRMGPPEKVYGDTPGTHVLVEFPER